MTLIADYGITGADQFVSKTKVMTSSVKALDGAWNKYSKSIAASSNMKSMIGGGKGGSGGGIIQSLVAFSIVGKVMEKLMGDTLKNWAAKLVKSDIEKYKNIGKSIGKFLKPVTDNLRANMKLAADGARTIGRDIYGGGRYLGRRGALIARMAGRKVASLGGVASKVLSKAPAAMRLAVIEGAIYAKVASRMFGKMIQPLIKGAISLITKTPISMLVTAPLLLAGLDSRLQEMMNNAINFVVSKIGSLISSAADGVGTIWNGFKVGLARVTDNAYYADSQVNWKAASQANTPQQQKAFMEAEKKRLTEADLEEFVNAEFKRMTKFFKEENEKRSKEIGRVQDMMIKQGRL
jgi:hypothetical protein